MAMGVYLISNTRSGMVYIGSSTDIERRWGQHRQELGSGCHQNRQLQRDWRHFGEWAFNFTVIEEVPDVTELSEAEQRWINHYWVTVGLPFLYNLELTVPPRYDPMAVTAIVPSRRSTPHEKLNRQAIVLAVFIGLVATFPISVMATRLIGPLSSLNQGWLAAYIGVVNVVTWIGVGVVFKNWYVRHRLAGTTVACPVCLAASPALDDFCPECGQPRDHVRRKLRRAAGRSWRTYEELIERERRKAQQPVRKPILSPDSGPMIGRLIAIWTYFDERRTLLYVSSYVGWIAFNWVTVLTIWRLTSTPVVAG